MVPPNLNIDLASTGIMDVTACSEVLAGGNPTKLSTGFAGLFGAQDCFPRIVRGEGQDWAWFRT